MRIFFARIKALFTQRKSPTPPGCAQTYLPAYSAQNDAVASFRICEAKYGPEVRSRIEAEWAAAGETWPEHPFQAKFVR